jgi:hypothetical protein
MNLFRSTGRATRGTGFVLAAAFLVLPLAGCGDDSAARQKEADDIAKGIESYLALISDPANPVTLHHDKVTVTPSKTDKSFAVAITGLRFGDTKGEGVTLGEVDYRLTPADKDTYQVDQLKLPAEIPVVLDAKTAATVRMSSGPFSATWSTPLHAFLKFAWQIGDLSVKAADAPDLTVHADSLTMNGDGKDAGNGRLDANTDIVLSDFTVQSPSENVAFKIAKVEDKASIAGFDLPAYQQQMEKLRALMAKLAPAAEQAAGAQVDAQSGTQSGSPSGDATTQAPTPAPTMPPLTDDDRKALADVVAALPKTVSGYSASLQIEGLAAAGKDGAPFSLAHAGSDFAFKGIDTDKAEIDLTLKHDGLDVKSPEMNDPRAQAILPKAGSLSLRATDLPVPSLVQAVANTLPELTSGDPSRVEAARFALMGAFMTTIGQSNIKLTVDPSWLDAAKAHLTADGAFTLATGMPAGTVDLGLTGLDDVTALFNATPDPVSMNALPILQQLHDLAKRETGADGKPVDKYTLTVAPGGMITVNGKPLSGL